MSDFHYDELLPQLREYYDRDAQRRAEMTHSAWKVVARAALLTRIQAEGKCTLLEIGAGPGRDALFFHENGLDVLCTDLSPAMVAVCQANGLTAHVKDFASLDFADSAFDVIYAMNCLLHVPNEALPAILANIRRMLVPGGLFYFGTYGGQNEESLFSGGPIPGSRYFVFRTDEQLKALVSPYFDLVDFTVMQEDQAQNHHVRFQSTVWRRAD
ncbi:MAG: class I SAM-dependent methyltransferase [Anaerolineales bacterium]|nr:class I SAM-dependent methyltransferase [Anaerolineales bacterium]